MAYHLVAYDARWSLQRTPSLLWSGTLAPTVRPCVCLAGYRQSKVFTEACDAGMCCDWSPSGALFAAVFQDGVAAVWDHRSSRVVAKLQQGSACRNVKFAPAPLDMLGFTEHKGRAHLLDMRMWGQQQVRSDRQQSQGLTAGVSDSSCSDWL